MVEYKLHNRNNRRAYLFIVIFIVLNILSESILLRGAALEDDTGAVSNINEKSRILSILPYVEITENGVAQPVPINSREDARANPNTTFLMIKLVIDNQDAQKYYGEALYIFKLKPHQDTADLSEEMRYINFIVQEDRFFEYSIKFLTDLSNLNNGEIYSKFVIAARTGNNEYTPISEARYIDNINCLSNRKDTPPVSLTKKGLAVQMTGEASLLGVEHTTVKIFMNEFMSFEENSNTEIYFYEGESFYFNINKISEYDRLIKNFTNDGIKVTAILLLGAERELRESRGSHIGDENDEEDGERDNLPSPTSPAHYFIHPNALENPLTDPNAPTLFYGINTVTETGIKYFSALMSFIADRYIREDTGYGRIYNIILGDEIGRSARANNCGQLGLEQYIRDYLIALRICDIAARSRFGGSRVYIPLDNRFASRPSGESGYNNKAIIDLLYELSEAEGNFPWNIAFHAYNYDRSISEIWRESEPTDDYSTPVITLKNINILCDYLNIEKEASLPDGERKKVMLAEQGFSSGEAASTEEKMNAQAAAYVYAYIKIRDLPDITAFIYHRHVDSDSEPYSYGLWTRFADSVNEPRRKKKIYDVFKYMETNKEAEHIEFAKDIIGIESFNEISADYSNEREPPVNLLEVAVTSVKSRLSNINISRFNRADLNGFIGTSNTAFMNIVKYSGESRIFGRNQNSLLIGFNRTAQGDYGGILKSYSSAEPLDISESRYIGMTVRIDTDIENIETVPLLLILEGEFVNTANEGNVRSTQPQNDSSVITSGVVQTAAALDTDETSKSIGIFEGAANIPPNEDVTVYFELKDFKESGKINKIKLLINPYYSHSGVQSSASGFLNTAANRDTDTDRAENDDDKISDSSEVAQYDFNLYVYNIVRASPSSMSVIRVILTIIIILIVIVLGGFGALVIRARIITYQRRKKRAEQRRRRQQRQSQTPPSR